MEQETDVVKLNKFNLFRKNLKNLENKAKTWMVKIGDQNILYKSWMIKMIFVNA